MSDTRATSDTRTRSARGSRLAISRSRGALSGILLIVLGVWGAFIPFVGPYFDFAYTPDSPWTWTLGRGWLEVLPGAVTALGGVLLLLSRNRATAMLGGWLAVAAGAWFVVGRALAAPLALGSVGNPVAVTEAKRVVLELAYFSGLGALIVFLAAVAVGRLSVRSVRDVASAEAVLVEPPASEPLPVASATGPIAATDTQDATVPRRRRAFWNRRTPVAH